MAAKTVPTKASVKAFVDAIPDPARRKDARALVKLMRDITGHRPVMWGSSIVGFGKYHYRYASGREGDWPLTGFSPRKRDITVYLMDGTRHYAARLRKLGGPKHSTGVSCLYLKGLEGVDLEVLAAVIRDSVARTRTLHPDG